MKRVSRIAATMALAVLGIFGVSAAIAPAASADPGSLCC